MKRVFMVVGVLFGVVVAVLAAALLYLTFGDLTRFRPEIETAVSDALGREFRIGGELTIEVLPHPSLSAADVSLANPDWASAEPLLTVGRVAVAVDLWSLLFRPIVIERLEISDARVLLEESADGRTNYTFAREGDRPAEPPPVGSEATAVPVILEHASIAAANISVRRPDAEEVGIVIESLDVSTSEDGSLSAMLKGSAQELSVALDAKLDPASALQSGGPASYRLDAALDDAAFGIEGEVDSLFASAANASDGGSTRRHVRFDGSVASLNLLGAVFDIANLPEQQLTLTGDLAFAPGVIALEPIAMTLGDSDFSGSASAEFGETLAIAVDGKSTKLDLTPFFPAQEGGDAQADAPASAAKGALVFADEPLSLEFLRELNLQLRLQAADLIVGDAQVKDLQLAIDNTDGRAKLETSFNAAQGGVAEGEMVLDASADTLTLEVDVEVTDMRLSLLSSGIDDPAQIPPIGAKVQLKSNGKSPHALASSANGRIVVQQGAGLIDNNAVGIVTNDIIAQLFAALNPFSKEEEHTKLECTVLALNVADGSGKLDPVLLETEKLQIVGKGDIDFHSEALDVEFNTKPRSGVGITADMLVTPFVKLSGTLAKPGVGLNTKGAFLQGGAAVLTGGASLLVGGLADRATAQAGRCGRALEAAGAPGENDANAR